MKRRTGRRGMTLLELIAVLVVVLVLGAIILPTLVSFRGDTRVRATADILAARVAEARVKAMEEGQPYRLALHRDGRQLRLLPCLMDGEGDAAEVKGAVASVSGGSRVQTDLLPETVTLQRIESGSVAAPPVDAEGWITLATFLSDGSCREDNVQVLVEEPGTTPLLVHLRGLTGVVSIRALTADGGGGL